LSDKSGGGQMDLRFEIGAIKYRALAIVDHFVLVDQQPA
jgi:hypothetical protein